MINAISIALSGLSAATKKITASASNIANLQTVGSLEDGGQRPYTPLTTQQSTVTDSQGNPLGVSSSIVPRGNPFTPAYDPDSPFADADGIIGVPNVDLAEEAINSKLAEITFKANIATLKTAEDLTDELFRIFDKKV
jgi:flagellar basal-body rod protein FlgC